MYLHYAAKIQKNQHGNIFIIKNLSYGVYIQRNTRQIKTHIR